MSWLARSIANSLKLDGDDDNNQNDIARHDTSSPPTKDESDRHSSPSSSSPTTPRGVKEDLSELTKTLTRQFWGVASFLAPPAEPSSSSSPPPQISEASQPSDPDALIEGIRSDFADIGGRFKSGISKLSSNKAMSEITKIASNFLQFGSDADVADLDLIGNVIGVTEEVVAFARDIAMHPETWLDFPVPEDDEFKEFDMSDAQQEHALAVERLAPRLAALRMELCPGYMSEGCFWKIYFMLLHPRLNKHDTELLSTPEIVEARSMLSSQNRAKPQAELKELDYPQSVSPPLETQSVEVVPLAVVDKSEVEMEKHPVQSSETQVVDKAMVEEQLVKQTKHQPSASSSSSSSKFVEDKFEDDGDDWLKEEGSEMVGTSRNAMPIGNDEDVSFSDLEDDDDDGDVPTSYKKVTSGSDSLAKDSRDWVQLSRSSSDSVKDISTVSSKHYGSEQVSALNSETKDSNDWLSVDDIDAM